MKKINETYEKNIIRLAIITTEETEKQVEEIQTKKQLKPKTV